MRYMGGKEKVASKLTQVIDSYRFPGARYVEPFVGGASVFSRVAPKFDSALGADLLPDVALLWQAVRDGWDPPEILTREEYEELRHAEPSPRRAFAGFGCSFGGKWFGGYATDNRGDDYAGIARRGLLKKAPGLAGAQIVHADYRALKIGEGDVVYCDPPYAGTTKYAGLPNFDHDNFWDHVARWSNMGATVLVSEYQAPEWAVEVWSKTKAVTLSLNPEFTKVEKLFLAGVECPSTSASS